MTEKDEYTINITGEQAQILCEWYSAALREYQKIADAKTFNDKASKSIELRNKIMDAEPTMQF